MALYSVSEERGGAALGARLRARMVAAVAGMLATAPNARFDAPEVVATVALGALVSPVMVVLKGQAPPGLADRLGSELVVLMTAYLEASALGR